MLIRIGFFCLLLVGASSWAADLTVQQDVVPEELVELDKATMKQWERLTTWQKNSDWVNEMARVKVVGSVYGHAWAGPDVRRFVYPDDVEGWVVIDQITLNGGLGLRLASLAGNLALSKVVPFLQIGPEKEETFVSVRKRKSYVDALTARPLIPSRFPVSAEGVERLEVGEVFSRVNSLGFVANSTLDPVALLTGRSLPISALGMAKVLISSKFNLNIWRSSETQSHVLIQSLSPLMLGYGIGLGAEARMLGGPVSINLEDRGGFTPVQINRTHSKIEQGTSVILGFDLSRPESRAGFSNLMALDLSETQKLLALKDMKGITRELIKIENTRETETNYGVNLVLYKKGIRHIRRHSEYDSTLADGRTFSYDQRSLEEVGQGHLLWKNPKSVSVRYSTIAPTSSVSAPSTASASNGQSASTGQDADPVKIENEVNRGFVFDVEFKIGSRKMSGKDLNRHLLSPVEEILDNPNFFPAVENEEKLREFRGNVRIRYPMMTMDQFFSKEDSVLWQNLGVSFGISDPTQWAKEDLRLQWAKRETGHGLEMNPKEKTELLDRAKYLMVTIAKIRKEQTPAARAQVFVNLVKDSKLRVPLLRLIARVVGRQALVISGEIKSGPN